MLKLPLLGAIRHMKLIGDHHDHKALRQRNEQRLAALKAGHRLTEEQHAKPPSARYITCAERAEFDKRRAELRSDTERAIFAGFTNGQAQYAALGNYGYVPGCALDQLLRGY